MFGLFKKKDEEVRTKVVIKQRSIMDSASYGDRLLQDLKVSSTQNNAEVIKSLNSIRGRSRTLFHNSDYLKKFVISAQRNIVGSELPVLVSLVSEVDGKPDDIARNEIEKAWKDFCGTSIDYNENLNMVQILHLWVQSLIVDGSFLAIKQKGNKAGKYGFSIQLVDNMLLDLNLNEVRKDTRIVGGIEFTKSGKPINYYIIDNDFGDYVSSTTGKKYTVVKAENIIYSYRSKFIGQTHGMPETWSSINTLHQIGETEKSALIAARHGATKMGFIENTEQGSGDYVGDYQEESGDIITEFKAGAIEELPFGKKYVAHDPKYPHEQLAVFLKAQLRKLASGWGMGYADLTDDLESVNLSAYRGSINESRETWKIWQSDMFKFLDEVYGDWLKMALLKNMIWQLPVSKYDKFYVHQFQGRRWFKVDPIKDEQANQMANTMKTKSLSEIIRERGKDPEEVFSEIAKENDKLRELGIVIGGDVNANQ